MQTTRCASEINSDRNDESQVLPTKTSIVCFEREDRRRIVRPHKAGIIEPIPYLEWAASIDPVFQSVKTIG